MLVSHHLLHLLAYHFCLALLLWNASHASFAMNNLTTSPVAQYCYEHAGPSLQGQGFYICKGRITRSPCLGLLFPSYLALYNIALMSIRVYMPATTDLYCAVKLSLWLKHRDLSFSSTIEVGSRSIDFISVIEASKSVLFFKIECWW